jgi:hypothetical protein
MASSNAFCTACPTNCASLILPALAVNQSCASTADLKKSQISYAVLLPNSATPPASWTSAANWATVIDNASIDNTKAKIWTVTGGVPAPNVVRVDMPLGKTAILEREYTLTLTRQKLDDSDYAFAKALQCGDTSFDFWYGSKGGYLYGGQYGIAPSEINVSFPKGAGKDDYDQIVIELKFKACGDPDRTTLTLVS